MPRLVPAALSAAACLLLLTGCGATPGGGPSPAPSATSDPSSRPDAAAFAAQLRDRVGIDAMVAHLQRLQDIAAENGGNRAAGTPGYDTSVDYVAGALRERGFDVTTPEFTFRTFTPGASSLTVGDAQLATGVLGFSPSTPPEGVTGPLVAAPADDSPGCTAQDWDGLPVRGAVALVDRGVCPFGVKEAAAAERGAVAVVVADNVDEERMGGTLGADNTDVRLPVVSVSRADGARLRAEPRIVTVRAEGRIDEVRTRNVIAQTTTGDTDDVVMAGAHLDSVPEGPGINDNGSGVSAVLETALQLGGAPRVRNAVRFAFWGAEELGLYGSQNYVESLDLAQLRRIALYLNFDMLGSPNAGYYTLDGDQSLARDSSGSPRIPEGSAGIERTLAAYLDGAGKPAVDTSFDGRSDYAAFTEAGVPAGGIFSGAEEKLTAQQAQEWGGQADQPADANYHTARDTLAAIDREALTINGDGVAWSVGLYAQDVTGRNGVPDLADRTRHALGGS